MSLRYLLASIKQPPKAENGGEGKRKSSESVEPKAKREQAASSDAA